MRAPHLLDDANFLKALREYPSRPNPQMFRRILPILLAAAAFAGCQRTDPTPQAESRVLRVVTSGGFAAAYTRLEPLFETETGIDLRTSYGSSSGGAPDSIPERLERGEAFDVVILSRASLDRLTERGQVCADSRVDLVRSMIGMAVKAGAQKPSISTVDDFVATLRAARSIGYSASASGRYLSTQLWPRMGIWKELEPKSIRVSSERVASVVARGEVEIGFQQISEILPIEGADYVGPIPAAVQKVTTFSAGIPERAENPSDAKTLLNYLSSKDVAGVVAATGLAPVVLEAGHQGVTR